MKKIIVAALGYMLISFPLAYSWHLIFFKKAYEAFGIYTRGQHPIIPLGILSMLIQGPILASLYSRWRGDGPRLGSAFKFCLLMGLFYASGTVITVAAKSQIANLPLWFGLNFVFHFLQFSLTALVFAAVFD